MLTMTLSDFMDHLSRVDAPDSACGFDMHRSAAMRKGSHLHSCGTACCIGGHAALLLGRPDWDPSRALSYLTGISLRDADNICLPLEKPPYRATLAQAMSLLEHYSATGVVDWSRAMEVAK